jgi:hypothetical protein
MFDHAAPLGLSGGREDGPDSPEMDGELPLEKVVEGYKHQGEYDFITFLECLTFDEQELFEEDDEFLVDPWY